MAIIYVPFREVYIRSFQDLSSSRSLNLVVDHKLISSFSSLNTTRPHNNVHLLQIHLRVKLIRQYPSRPTKSETVPLFVEQSHFLWNSSTFCGTVPQFVEQRPKNVEQLPKKWNRSCKRVSVQQIVDQKVKLSILNL